MWGTGNLGPLVGDEQSVRLVVQHNFSRMLVVFGSTQTTSVMLRGSQDPTTLSQGNL